MNHPAQASSSFALDVLAELDKKGSGPLPLGAPLAPTIVASLGGSDEPSGGGAAAARPLLLPGPNLFRGYVGDQGGGDRGGGFYDTSDLAAFVPVEPGDPAGAFDLGGVPHALVHRGRADDVVKVRGFRVDLGSERVIQRPFNLSVLDALGPEQGSLFRGRPER